MDQCVYPLLTLDVLHLTDEVITAQLHTRAPMMDGCNLVHQAEPRVFISVQPQGKALRFRYKCEGRYPGALTGIGTTTENKSYPTIRVSTIPNCITGETQNTDHSIKEDMIEALNLDP